MAEKLDLHLLKLARAKRKVPRRDLIAKALAHLGDAERDPHARAVADVAEIDKNALRGLRPQERRVLLGPQSSHDRLEHQIEIAGLGQLALVVLARMLARLQRAFAG